MISNSHSEYSAEQHDLDLQRLTTLANAALLIAEVARLHKTGTSTAALAQARHCKPYEIRHLLRLDRRLTEKCKRLLERELLSLGHARALATWPPAEQDRLVGECIARRWTVRELEKRRREMGENNDPEGLAAHFERLAEQVGEQTGYPCAFIVNAKNPRAGQLTLAFASLEELDGILRRLRIKSQDDW